MYLRCCIGILLLAAILVSAEDPRYLEEELAEPRTKRHVTDDEKELLDAIAEDPDYSDGVMEDPWWFGRGFGFRFGLRRRFWFDDTEAYDPVEAGLADAGMNDPGIAPTPRKCRKWCKICKTPRCRRKCRKHCPRMSDPVVADPSVADYLAGEVNRQHRYWDYPETDSLITWPPRGPKDPRCGEWCLCNTQYSCDMCRYRCP